MEYSAYCLHDAAGGVRLAMFFEGFIDKDDAQMFLRLLMAPYEPPYPESDTIH